MYVHTYIPSILYTFLIFTEHEITQKLLKRVLEEVKANGNSKSSTRKTIIPKTPFKEEKDFKDFEAKIEKSENIFNDLLSFVNKQITCILFKLETNYNIHMTFLGCRFIQIFKRSMAENDGRRSSPKILLARNK